MSVHYLEIVTESVEETCAALAAIHDVEFGEPVADLGQARVATTQSGSLIGVRAPLAEHDRPITRPYLRVENIEDAITKAEAAGAQFAMKATDVPSFGKFAIYFLGGLQFGLWEV